MQLYFFGLNAKERKYFTIDRHFSTSTFREKRKLIERYSKKMRYLEAIGKRNSVWKIQAHRGPENYVFRAEYNIL